MVNVSAPFVVPARERRKPTAQKRDACVVNDRVELFLFVGAVCLFSFFFFWERGKWQEKGNM